MYYEKRNDGIYYRVPPVQHRNQEYDPAGYELLRNMQEHHFWYVGRHRFIYRAFRLALNKLKIDTRNVKAIDIGGGCGGWIKYLSDKAEYSELAIGDSSIEALNIAKSVIRKSVDRYHIDLTELGWNARWDVIFMLDVIEHIPKDENALSEVVKALKPGGLLVITAPALKLFWSYNDEFASHVRRYNKKDMNILVKAVGCNVLMQRYFMFFLSIFVLMRKALNQKMRGINIEDKKRIIAETHRIPPNPINAIMRFIFQLETPLGVIIPFPWGTSILAIFQKPHEL